jgi:hypothetical protein
VTVNRRRKNLATVPCAGKITQIPPPFGHASAQL